MVQKIEAYWINKSRKKHTQFTNNSKLYQIYNTGALQAANYMLK
uniref:Uncharacterized protein n=1 Tax=Arundo donax TaxID=35708 RepID=A0A0A9FS77_ARUDO